MKKILVFCFFILSAFVFVGCGNKDDQVMNEMLAHTYIKISDDAENLYKKFKKDDFEPLAKFKTHAGQYGKSDLEREIGFMDKEIESEKEYMTHVKATEKGKEFYDAMVKYIDFIDKEYNAAYKEFNNLEDYSDENIAKAKEKIEKTYEKLCTLDDNMIKVQNDFFKKAGLKGKK